MMIFDFSNLRLCWLIRSASKDEKVRLEVQQSFLQPRSYSGEWTDYLLVAEGKSFKFTIFTIYCATLIQLKIKWTSVKINKLYGVSRNHLLISIRPNFSFNTHKFRSAFSKSVPFH